VNGKGAIGRTRFRANGNSGELTRGHSADELYGEREFWRTDSGSYGEQDFVRFVLQIHCNVKRYLSTVDSLFYVSTLFPYLTLAGKKFRDFSLLMKTR
jgi:hypothetical protein